MRIANGQEVIQAFEQMAPKRYAMEGDKVGLQLGTLNKPITTVMTALDVTEEVVDEAITNGVELIIAHHPLIFHPIKKIATDTAYGRIIEACLKHNISVYVAHTNLDVAKGGVNDALADRLALQEIEVLVPTYEDSLKKVAVFVPDEYADAVRTAVSEAGAGFIGEYSHCTYSSSGTGTFLPHEGAQPFLGEAGKLTSVNEQRLETIFPASLEKKVLSRMMKAHPYEEPAYDIYALDNPGEVYGLGRIGKLPKEMKLAELANQLKNTFDLNGLRIVGNPDAVVKKVAILGGDGNKYWSHAKMKGADVYITGDIYYHVAHDAQMQGLNMIDPGHNVEKVMKKTVKDYLTNYFTEKKLSTKVIESAIHTDPFSFL